MPKPIPPTLRERNRYIAFELISDVKFKRDEVARAVWNSALEFLGESGTAKSSLWFMEWDDENQRGILKVNHKSVEQVRAALALLRDINKKNCIFHAFGVSGTVKKTREKNVVGRVDNYNGPAEI